MTKKNLNTIVRRGGVVVAALTLSTLAFARPFVPYPGKRLATNTRVESPERILVTFNTDETGFVRTLAIRMPGIVMAKDTPRSDECERAAAKRLQGFIQKFLDDAKKVYVKDMVMTNTADDSAVSQILTDKGSLSAALVNEGLARSDTVKPDTPWCK